MVDSFIDFHIKRHMNFWTYTSFTLDRTGPLNLAPRTLHVFMEGARQSNREVLAAHTRAVASDNDGIPRAPPRLRPPRRHNN